MATIEDAEALGRVHVRAWQAAYRGGLMPDQYLDAVSVEDRTVLWQQRLALAPSARSTCLVAEDEQGAVVGFVHVGTTADEPGAPLGEIHALNVDPDHWGAGAGCDLLAWGVETLDRSGFSRAVLWVHPGNARARRFYRVHGWRDDDLERQQDVLGVMVPETRYSRSLG